MKLTFYGAAQSVTGSNYLLKAGDLNILVDCGMFQGLSDSEEQNYQKFPYDPASIQAVLITHSHADHAARVPKLFKEGFRGTIYATNPTLDMMRIALPDNLSLVSQEAKRDQHEALFTQADLDGAMSLAKGVNYGETINLGSGVKATFHDAGHILGSAIIEIEAEGKKIYFSGDLGNPPTPLLKPYEYPADADYIVVESTYGDRVHEDRTQRKEKLRQVIRDTIASGGVLMIPSFAMERTQELLSEMHNMINVGEIPKVPIFVDSPLAIRLTDIYQKYPDYFNTAAGDVAKSGDDLFNFPGLEYMLTTEQSKQINEVKAPKVIIAGSGMSSGGRILHHESRYLSDPNSAILFVGYQADGTLGRKIFDGAPSVKIFGDIIQVRCHVKAIGGYSSHADQPQLLEWLGRAGKDLKQVFVIHGEAATAATFAQTAAAALGIPVVAPQLGQSFEL